MSVCGDHGTTPASYPPGIVDVPSPNHGPRGGGVRPSLLVLHYTGMTTAREALDRLRDPEAEVSAHYLVDEDGAILRLVAEDRRAWHAGRSSWAGCTDINSLSVGIEIVNPGHEHGYRPFPAAQMESVIALCRAVMARYGMTAFDVLAHSDVAPARKQDPGELFDWRMMAGRGVGIWPVPEAADEGAAQALQSDAAALRAAFTALGYDPDVAMADVVCAFQRRFQPALFAPGTAPRQVPVRADRETALLLSALLRLKGTAG